MHKPLTGRVAVVFGATRAAGRGIAEELGIAGATVYCAGRSTADAPHDGDARMSVERTVERVRALGGEAIPAYLDATDGPSVAALFARVREERGRLDVLANSVWGYGTEGWAKPFWEQDTDAGFGLAIRVLRAHVLPLIHALPLLRDTAEAHNTPGLIATVSDVLGIGLYDDLAHILQHRIAESVRVENERWKADVAAVTLIPGWLRNEEDLLNAGLSDENWPDLHPGDTHWLCSQTPRYAGRAVVALAADPDIRAHSGKVYDVADLAARYAFDDIDGRRPANHPDEAA